VSRDAGCLGDPGNHPVGIPPVDRVTGQRSQDERAAGPFAAAGLQDAQDWDGDRHGGGLVAFAHEVQDAVWA